VDVLITKGFKGPVRPLENIFVNKPEDTMPSETKTEKKKDKSGRVGVGKMIAWQSRAASVGSNLMVIGFLSIYCTDTLKIPPALVGVLFLASRIFDGLTDLAAGFLVDKTNTKLGRGRPYEFAIIGVWLCTWLMFSCPPEWTIVAKCAWVFTMYVFVNAIFITLLNAANTPYIVRAFAKQEQYVALQTYGSLITMVIVVAVNVSFPMLMARLAVSSKGWSQLIAIYAIPLGLFGILRLIFIKETNKIDDKYAEKLRIKDLMGAVKLNPYIFVILVLTVIINIILNMGINTYYFAYIVKDIGQMGVLAAVQIVTLPLMFILPPIIKKFSVTALIGAGFLVAIAGYIINFAAYDQIPLLAVGGILIGAGNVPFSMLITLLIIDCADFNEWKDQPRLEGTLGSLRGFAEKVGAALGAALVGILLSAAGYTGAVETATEAATVMIRMLYTLIPAVVYAVLFVLLRFYKLEKIIGQVRKENGERRALARETTSQI
jgi:probable glucitol transport protein GutA